MSNLDKLLKRWSAADAADDTARDCPPLPLLWYHVSEGDDLDPYTAHVPECPRCQHRLTILRAELAKAGAPLLPSKSGERTVTSNGLDRAGAPLLRGKGGGRTKMPGTLGERRKTIPFLLAASALAASIVLVVLLPTAPEVPSFVPLLNEFAEQVYSLPPDSPMRGVNRPPFNPGAPGTRQAERSSLDRLLADQRIIAALADQERFELEIRMELNNERLILDPDGRPTLAPTIDEATARRLTDLLAKDRAATERLVDALLQALPDASESDRPALRRTLARYRAKAVFGIQN